MNQTYNLYVYGYTTGFLSDGMTTMAVVETTSKEAQRRKYRNIKAQIRRNSTRKKQPYFVIMDVEYAK